MLKKWKRTLIAGVLSLVMVYGCGDKMSDHMREVRELLLQHKYEQAKTEYEAALELEPESVEAHRGLVFTVDRLDDINYTLGIRTLKQDYSNRNFETKGLQNYLLGLISSYEGNTTRAEEYLNKSIEENAEEAWFYYSLGNVYEKRGRHEKAEEIYKRLIGRFPEFIEGYQTLLIYYDERSRYDDAIALYEENEELEVPAEKAVEFYSAAALAYLKSEEEANAEDLVSKARAVIKKTPGNMNNIIESYYLKSEQYDKAVEAAEEIINRFPENPVGYYTLGKLEGVHRENLAKGISNCKKAEELGADSSFYRGVSASLYFSRGEKYYQEGAYDEGIIELEKGLEIKPTDGRILYKLGFCYLRKAERKEVTDTGDLDKALTYFDRIIKNHENKLMGYNGVASVYLQRGDYDLAIGTYEKALESFPEDIALLTNIGLSYLLQRDYEKAEEYYLRVLEMDPEDSSILLRLGNVYAIGDNPAADLEKAAEYTKRAIEAECFEGTDEEAQAHGLLAEIYVLKGIGALYLYRYPIKKEYKELAIEETNIAIELDRSKKYYVDNLDYIESLPEK